MSDKRGANTTPGLVQYALRQTLAPWQHALFGTDGKLGCKPTNITIELTYACNLRCRTCDSWKMPRRDELSIEEWKAALGSLRDWLGAYRLSISGGEPFLKPGIWELLEYCAELGLPVVVITNGYAFSQRQLDRLLSTRLTQLVVSIDGLNPETHNNLRGRPNAFERTWSTLRYLADRNPPFALATNTVIVDDNLLELGELASRLAELGVNRILFQPVQGNFTTGTAGWPFGTDLWPTSQERIQAGFASLLEMKERGLPIANSPEQLMHFRDYLIKGSSWQRPWPCTVGYTSLVADASGRARICVMSEDSIGTLRLQSASAIWGGDNARKEREAINACQLGCMVNCARQYSLSQQLHLARTYLLRGKAHT